jgi:hypothetical protein
MSIAGSESPARNFAHFEDMDRRMFRSSDKKTTNVLFRMEGVQMQEIVIPGGEGACVTVLLVLLCPSCTVEKSTLVLSDIPMCILIQIADGRLLLSRYEKLVFSAFTRFLNSQRFMDKTLGRNHLGVKRWVKQGSNLELTLYSLL